MSNTNRPSTTTKEGTMTADTQANNLQHAEGCPAARVETTDYADRGIITHHCLDCGAHEARDRAGKVLRVVAISGALAGSRPNDSDVMRKADTR